MKQANATIGNGIYTAADAARILNIPYSKAVYWFRDYAKNKLSKSTNFKYHFEVKDCIAVNFLSLIEMNVFYTLKEHGIKTKVILKAHASMSKALKSPYPFATRNLYIDGGKILFGEIDDLTLADPTLQKIIAKFVAPLINKISFNKEGIATKYYPFGEKKSIVVNPKNQFGQPVIEGTNILAATIISLHKGGESNKSIAKLYNISLKNVKDAIGFLQAA